MVFTSYIFVFYFLTHNTVAHDLQERAHTSRRFASGAALFILGFAKKVLFANPIGTVADAAFGAQSLDAPAAWFGVVAYALQIYFDSAGTELNVPCAPGGRARSNRSARRKIYPNSWKP